MSVRVQRVLALARKETTQMLRDRRLLAFILGLPVIQLILYGYAAHLTVYHLPLVVADQSRDERSRALVDALVTSQYFDVVAAAEGQAQAAAAIGRGEARAALVVPPGFADRAARGEAEVLFLLDGSDTASVQSGYAAAALVAQQESLRLSARGVAGGRALPIEATALVLYNPALIDIWFVLPGLVGLILQTMAITQAALIVVRERELGTLEQILVTPARPAEMMAAKVAPLLGLCLAAMAAVVGIGTLWFGVPFRGSAVLYLALALLFIAASLGLGLLLSTRATTQAEATQYGLVFMMVGILMSGFMYPQSAMPPALQAVSGLFPVTYFIRISRAIVLRGAGLRLVWGDAAMLALYATVAVGAAARSFRTRLD